MHFSAESGLHSDLVQEIVFKDFMNSWNLNAEFSTLMCFCVFQVYILTWEQHLEIFRGRSLEISRFCTLEIFSD